MKVSEFIPTYERRHIRSLKPSSQVAQWQILNKAILPLFGDRELASINRKDAQTLHDYATIDRKLSNRTSNEYLGVLSTILKCAIKSMEIDAMPVLDRLRPGKQEDHRYLTEKQVAALKGVLKPGFLKDMISVALNTGMRIGELRALKWSDLSPDRTSARVAKSIYSRCEDEDSIVSMKGKEIRTIYFRGLALEAIKRRRKVGAFVFFDDDDKVTSGSLLPYKSCHERGIVRLMKEAGVWQTEFGFHTLRHTFASGHAQRKTSPYELQKLMGHRHLATTMRYVEMFERDLEQAAANIDDLFGI